MASLTQSLSGALLDMTLPSMCGTLEEMVLLSSLTEEPCGIKEDLQHGVRQAGWILKGLQLEKS